ncbi:MAG: hypothetical protein ACREMX_12600 [Gemmatimonadales bacterium]
MLRRPLTLIACALLTVGCSSSRSSEDPRPEPSVQEQLDSAAARMSADSAPDTTMGADTSTSQ